MSASIILEGSLKNNRPLKTCDICGKPSEPSSGVQLNQVKWGCYKCWRLATSRK